VEASPNAEQIARAVLQIFANRGLRPGEAISRTALEQEFFQSSKFNSFKQSDFEGGLTCAIKKEWLSNKETDFELRLLGFAEIPGNGRVP
jgi:hypothetical protein